MKNKNYNYSKYMWVEIGKYCVNAQGERSVQIPTDSKNSIKEGDFKVLKIKKIEFDNK